MLVVHHLSQSHSHVVLWLLEELGVDYKIVHHTREKTGRSPDSLRAVHPLGKAPTIEDRGVTMVESTGILLYILETYGQGKLRPAPGTPEAMERRTLGYLDALPAAVRTLTDVRPAVVVLAHTGVSYLNGAAGEAALAARLSELAGTRATTAAGAVSAGLRRLGVKRLALATPYPESISAAGRR